MLGEGSNELAGDLEGGEVAGEAVVVGDTGEGVERDAGGSVDVDSFDGPQADLP